MTTNNSSLAHFRKKELDRSFSSHAKNDDYSYELLVEQYTADEDFEFYPKSYRSIEEKAKEEIKLHPNLGWCMGRRRTVIETENITVQLEWKKYIPNNMFSPEDCFQHWLEN